VYVCQPHVPAAVEVGLSLVVNAKLMQDGCPQIVNVTWALDSVVAQFIGGSVSHPTFEAPSSDP
jgi:hypothetical protein